MDKKLQKAYLSAIIYATIIGLSFLFSKIALRFATPVLVLAYRFTVSFVTLIVGIMMGKVTMIPKWERAKKLLPVALFYPFLFMGFQTFGLMTASSSEGGIIQAVAPVLIMIMGQLFLAEKPNFFQKISIVVSVSGVLYILIKKGSAIDLANLRGIILLLCAVVSFAIYNVLARKLIQDFTIWELSSVAITFSFVTFNAFTLVQYAIRGTLLEIITPLRNLSFITAVLYLGGFATLGTSMLNSYALSKLEVSRVSVFGNLGTTISILAGVLFLQEKLYLYHIIGSLLIIGGVLGTNLFAETNFKEEQHGYDKTR